MNHTIKSIIIVVVITSMLVVGMNMFPLAQNTYASSHRHQDSIANQQDDTYRSPGSESSNVAIQESGKGNSATAFSDQSSNTQQQNQPTVTTGYNGYASDKSYVHRMTKLCNTHNKTMIKDLSYLYWYILAHDT